MRHPPIEYPTRVPPEEYYGRRQVVYDTQEYTPLPPRERVRPYREVPPHRQPEHYPKFEEEHPPVSAAPKVSCLDWVSIFLCFFRNISWCYYW